MVECTGGFHQLSALTWARVCRPMLGKTLPLAELLPLQKAEGMAVKEVSAQKDAIVVSRVHNNSSLLHRNYRLENAAADHMSTMRKWTCAVKGIEL